MSNQIRTFKDLECWKKAREIRLFVKEILSSVPKNEQFDLNDNMRRAARSCTRNIAEGYGRFHFQENIQFCRISRGSMFEIWDDLITCLDEKYITEQKFTDGEILIQDGIKILNGYIHYLEKAKGSVNTSSGSITNEPEEIYGLISKFPDEPNVIT